VVTRKEVKEGGESQVEKSAAELLCGRRTYPPLAALGFGGVEEGTRKEEGKKPV